MRVVSCLVGFGLVAVCTEFSGPGMIKCLENRPYGSMNFIFTSMAGHRLVQVVLGRLFVSKYESDRVLLGKILPAPV